ncbi:protein kinase [Myxococcus llanfairpwllgwyngyllgogerychwyrndrobwllllantysiliogogogochensis]|uniref:Protein kinase n=1 Tax=Myxococcus llanfairpwllgwyngyllgogerychwyrndrobwllllantysiliogogogochensis TaxID=2590453 RepID=A0A540WRK7_9BACT|nr:serine/threonine-protein kinase [Myxococcus llanfairpwllgwyngyllgogerychwyrndrobwllllantysiliogogogochensis]TQF11623.1 protein kinase [Myxococcus llanfairpwllgwyngyllgogerychwyrndrobwllllantysiliogogogochensis]
MIVSPDMGNPGQTQFGRYELLERLGAGGMAVVYRARYPAAPGVTKSVVIKRVLGHYASEPAFAEMFLNEARICVSLSHGNVVQVFDFGQVDGEYFLAMEWVDGHPLSRVLKRAKAKGLPRLPVPIAAGIAIDMCRGLHYAHTLLDEQGEPLGLVHRDISPDNVLMSFEGEVKISDFGIAKARLAGRAETEAGVVKGKYQYFSPEQARGETLDARSDVYAVGVVLYQMLCGQLPNDGGELEVMFRTVEGRLTPAQQLNPTLDAAMLEILQRALMKSRDQRYRTAEALQQSLSDWLSTNAPLFPNNTRKHLTSWLFQEELATRKRMPALPSGFLSQLESWRASSVAKVPGPPAWSPEAPRVTPPLRAVPHLPPAVITEPAVPEAAFPAEPETASPMSAEVAPRTLVTPRGASMAWRAVVLITLGLGLLSMGRVWSGLMEQQPLDSIWITSEPSGAEVSLDGIRFERTPMRLSDTQLGSQLTLTVRHEGFLPWEGTYAARALTANLNVQLKPAPPRVDPRKDEVEVVPEGDALVEEEAWDESEDAEEEVAASDSSLAVVQEPPARALMSESRHSFNPIRRARELVLNPAETYTLRTVGSYGLTWSKALDGARPAPTSHRVLAFIADPDVPPERRLRLLTTDAQKVKGVTRMWVSILWGREWAFKQPQLLELEVRSRLGGVTGDTSLNVAELASELEPESRFTVRRLRPALRYMVQIRASKGQPRSPVVMVAFPAASYSLRVTGQPANERLHVLDVGRHFVSGASELWFSLPRWAKDAEVEMEIVVEAA